MANELAKMYMAYGKGRTIPVEQQEQEQTASKPFTPQNVFFPMAGGYNLPQPKPTLTEQSLLAPAPIVQPTVEQPLEQIQEAFKAESIESPITKQEEEKVLQDPVALRKYSKAGNMFASFGGFQEAPQELLAQATPKQLESYNKQKLAARNKGIGEMLLMLSDALGGRDVAMRALERQKAKQPKQKNVGQIRSEILNKLMVGQKINREEFNTLVAIDPNYRDLSITNPELFDFTEESTNESEESDKEPSPEELVKKYT